MEMMTMSRYKTKHTGMKTIILSAIGAYALTKFMCPDFDILPDFNYDKSTEVYQTRQAQEFQHPVIGITTEHNRG